MKKRYILAGALALTLLVSSPRAAVVINEVFYDPLGNDNTADNREFVELYNNGSDPVYLGYHLVQTAGPFWKTTYVIAPGTIIPASAYLLIAEWETFGVAPDLAAGLGLPNGNYDAYYEDQWHSFTKPVVGVRLVTPDGAAVLDCLLYNDGELGNAYNLETDGAVGDGFYGDVPSGYSISRATAGYDSDYLSDWETLTDPTPTARGPLLDSDGDGLLDVIENFIGSNPQNPDSDGDGLLDGEEMRSGYLGIGPRETDPRIPDTDGDGLWDGLEVNTYYSRPWKPDTDGDSLLDGEEVYTYGTSPTNPDSDFDGYPDGWEATYGTDPADPASRPGVVINEVYYDHPGSDERIEYLTLFNPEDYDVGISYFRVESAGTSFQRNLSFPAGTVIPSGCFFLIGEEDAVDMNGNPPDLIAWLDLQNGDQNDPDAYYYGALSPADGVRLTGPKGEGPAIAIDTVLWDGPNDNDLPGDAGDPATADELIPDVQPGHALRRRIVGYDTNHKSDWESGTPIKVSSASGWDPDCDGLTNLEEAIWGTNPYNPDTDGDSVADGDEVWHDYDPLDANSVPGSVPGADIRKFPIKSGDFDGDGIPDISIFRPTTHLWAIKNITRVYYGTSGDIPQPGDYDGDGTTDIGVFRPADSLWAVRNITSVYFGNQDDLPVSGDYTGDATCNIGIFRPANGLWRIRDITRIYFGTSGDVPVPANYGGAPSDKVAIFRPSNGFWGIRGYTRVYFGRVLDIPIPEAWFGTVASPAIFRERSGLWAIRGVSKFYYGTLGDLPAPAKWAADKTVGLFRPATGLWNIRNHTRIYYGQTHDIPMPMLYRGTDSDCDGLPDWWEEEYFGNLSPLPQDNHDVDGCNNLEEYRNGTDPTISDCGYTPVPTISPSPTLWYYSATQYLGWRYDDVVPNTLDLEERANLAINAITRTVATNIPDYEEHDYFHSYFRVHLGPAGPTMCELHPMPKIWNALTHLRRLTGSSSNSYIDQAWAEWLIKYCEGDAIATYYIDEPVTRERALMTIHKHYLHTRNPLWKEYASELIDWWWYRMTEQTGPYGNYCYLANPGGIMPTGHNAALKHGWLLEALVHNFMTYGDQESRLFADKLARYMRYYAQLFSDDGEFLGTYMSSDVYLTLHFHINANCMQSLAWYAWATNNYDYAEFVQKCYEWLKTSTNCIPYMGYFPEYINGLYCDSRIMANTEVGCNARDMMNTAILLSRMGVEDYWDEVDQIIRNMLSESQMLNGQWADNIYCSYPPLSVPPSHIDHCANDPGLFCNEGGGFGGFAMPNDMWRGNSGPNCLLFQNCCLGNGAECIYIAWDSILQNQNDEIIINLLLNRSSKWLDIRNRPVNPPRHMEQGGGKQGWVKIRKRSTGGVLSTGRGEVLPGGWPGGR